MSIQRNADDRLLTEQERVDVQATRYPDLLHLSRADLLGLLGRLRADRDRAQTIGRRQQREMRGKAEARGARPARDNAGTLHKMQVLAQAVKRANKELARREEPEPDHEAAPTQAELTRKAFAMVQAARAAQHPSAGRTARTGMRSNPSHQPTVQMDPREIGRVSQATRAAQAKHDS